MRATRAVVALTAGAALLAPLVSVPAAEAANVSLTGTLTAVVDGDTVKVKTGPSTVLTVDLRGAVVGPACAPSAKSRLASFVGTRVSLTASGRTGTVTATVVSGQTNLSRRLVALGVAAVGRTGGLTSAQITALNQAQASASTSKLGRFAPGGCGNDGLVAPAGWTVRGNLDALLLAIPAANRPTRAALKNDINQQSALIAQFVKPGRQYVASRGDAFAGTSLLDSIALCAGGGFRKHVEVTGEIVDLFQDSPATTIVSGTDSQVMDTRGAFTRTIDLRPSVAGWTLTLTPRGGGVARVSQLGLIQTGTGVRVTMFNFPQSGYAHAAFTCT